MEGNEVIINKEILEQRFDVREFTTGDVFEIDIYVLSGDGIGRKANVRFTVYKGDLNFG